jgi:pilus assembly protein Flp/PilA
MIRTYIDRYYPREEGATAVEYGIMVALIAVVIIVAVIALGTNLREMFSDVAETIGAAGGD